MSKSKMHKYELATHKTTEVRAVNSIVNEQVNAWVLKVREAGKLQDGDGVNSSIERVAKVLESLIAETRQGKCDRDVISEVVKRCNVTASLLIVKDKLR